MDRIKTDIISSKILLEDLISFVQEPEFGAQTLFSGVVRNHNHGKKVLAVSYDVFEPLARATFEEICNEAATRWGSHLKYAIVHRVGKLSVGELSIAIAVGSRHRDECYQASRYLIENIKRRAPIWKKEHYEDGETEWLEGHTLCGEGHSLEN